MEASRKKSCRQCRRAKTRCSLGTPLCSRCEKRKLDCSYERYLGGQNIQNSNKRGPFHSWVAATKNTLLTSESSKELDADGLDDSVFPGNTRGISEFLNLEITTDPILDSQVSGLEWSNASASTNTVASGMAEHVDRMDLLESVENDFQNGVSWFQLSPKSPDPLFAGRTSRSQTSTLSAPDRCYSTVSNMSLAIKQSTQFAEEGWKVLHHIPDKTPFSSLLQRLPGTTGASLAARNFMWTTIKSFPYEFAKGTTPPFIHKSIFSGSVDDLTEPWANCRTIVGMYSQRTRGSRVLIQKTLLLEVQRLYNEIRNYSERTLIEVVGALTIYMILLAMDENRCSTTSFVTRIAVGEAATRAYENGYVSANEARGNFPSWEEWVLLESKRRTLLMLHLLSLLLDLSLGAPPPPKACSYLDLIPLPSSKKLWESEASATWEMEYERYISKRKGVSMLTVRDLCRSKDMIVGGADGELLEDISNWSKEIDNFGGMFLLATQLLL